MAAKTPSWEEQKQKAINEVKAVLDRYNAVLDPQASLRSNSIEMFIDIVPKPPVTPKPEAK